MASDIIFLIIVSEAVPLSIEVINAADLKLIDVIDKVAYYNDDANSPFAARPCR